MLDASSRIPGSGAKADAAGAVAVQADDLADVRAHAVVPVSKVPADVAGSSVPAGVEATTGLKNVPLAVADRAHQVDAVAKVTSSVAKTISLGGQAEMRVASRVLKQNRSRVPGSKRNEMMTGEKNERPPAANQRNLENPRDGADAIKNLKGADADVVAKIIGSSVPLAVASRGSRTEQAVADASRSLRTEPVVAGVVAKIVGSNVPRAGASKSSITKGAETMLAEGAQENRVPGDVDAKMLGKSVLLADANKSSRAKNAVADASKNLKATDAKADEIPPPEVAGEMMADMGAIVVVDEIAVADETIPDRNVAEEELKVTTSAANSHPTVENVTRKMLLVPSMERTQSSRILNR